MKGFAIASEIADRLAKAGVPFRDAHRIVGRAVREGDLSRVKEIAKEMGYDVDVDLSVDVREVVDGRISLGGTSKAEVERMIVERRRRLDEDYKILAEKVEKVCSGLERLYEEVSRLINRNI